MNFSERETFVERAQSASACFVAEIGSGRANTETQSFFHRKRVMPSKQHSGRECIARAGGAFDVSIRQFHAAMLVPLPVASEGAGAFGKMDDDTFAHAGLDWERHVVTDREPQIGAGDR